MAFRVLTSSTNPFSVTNSPILANPWKQALRTSSSGSTRIFARRATLDISWKAPSAPTAAPKTNPFRAFSSPPSISVAFARDARADADSMM